MEFEEEHGWQTVRGKHRANRRFNQFSPDIATARNFSKDNISTTTTFFFTNFPERYGAKAVFNAFHNIGEVMEVVIPAKRDKGGRRFGFARFDQVSDLAKLESDLDNLVFGGVKISANLSRFQRSDGGAMESGRKGRSFNVLFRLYHGIINHSPTLRRCAKGMFQIVVHLSRRCSCHMRRRRMQ
jgi:hypothetical protein